MKRWMGLLALLAGSATAGDELAAMNAASKAWDDYVRLQLAKDPALADRVSASTHAHFAFLRDVARYGSREQLHRLPSADRLIVYGLRARHDGDALATLDGAATYRDCVTSGLCTAVLEHAQITPPSLVHVTLVSPTLAVGEGAPPDGTRYNYGPSLVLEQRAWRVRAEGLAPELSALINGGGRDADPELLRHLVGHGLGEGSEPPLLAQLDIAPANDPSAQRALNERWPDYTGHVRERVEATRAKAEAGEALAQWMYGSLLYTGEMALVPKDAERGLAMIEAASNAGHTDAAMGATMALLEAEDPSTLPPERVARALPHLQRAAAAGMPLAMGGLAQFHADGAAGLTRDCEQAAYWYQKAEDAGLEEARNNRVWLLATCARADQRDPAQAMRLAAYMIENHERLGAFELDTLAAVFAANRDFDRATEYQQTALSRLDDAQASERDGMQARLALYRNGQAYVDDEPDYRSTP